MSIHEMTDAAMASSPADDHVVRKGKPSRRAFALVALAFAAIISAVFFPVLGFEFVDYDTVAQVVLNRHIRGLTWENVHYIFTSKCITSYYPVRTLTFAVNYQLFGLNAGAFKATNVLFHLVNCMLVFWLAWRLPRDADAAGNPRRDLALAAFAGAIYAVHSVVVETVVWIPGREELLMVMGALGTIHLHISACRRGDAGAPRPVVLAYHAGAIVCCACACLSNAIGAVIPALVVAWDVLLLRRRKWTRMLLSTAPLWLISLATLVTKIYDEPLETVNLLEMTAYGRLLTGLNAYWLNLKTLLWPSALCLHYDWLYPKGLLDLNILMGVVAVVLSLGVLWAIRRQKLVLLGLLWFGMALAPYQQLVPHHIHRADRFLYLPLVGAVVAIAMALRPLATRIKSRTALGASVALGLVLVTALAVRSSFQVQTWRTSMGVWQHAMDLFPENGRVHDVVADHYARTGRYKEAVEHYEFVLARFPYAVETLQHYGHYLATWDDPELRDFDRAVELLKRAHSVVGWRNPGVQRTLAHVHANYAYHLLHETHEYARAIQEYQRSLEARPDDPETALNLALLLATCPDEKLRRPGEAIRLAEMARSAQPQPNVNGLLILASVYAHAGRFGEAAMATADARDLARQLGDEKKAAALQPQLELYERLLSPGGLPQPTEASDGDSGSPPFGQTDAPGAR